MPVLRGPTGLGATADRAGRDFTPASALRDDRRAEQPSAWSPQYYWACARNWNALGPAVRASWGSARKSFILSLADAGCGRFPRSARSARSYGGMGIPRDLLPGKREAVSPIPHHGRAFLGICTRQVRSVPGIFAGPGALPASARATPWRWWAGVRRASSCGHKTASLFCEHSLASLGLVRGADASPRSTTKWPSPVGGHTPWASRWSCACTCCWVSISSSSRRGNRAGALRWGVSTTSGRSAFGAGRAPTCALCDAQIEPFCVISTSTTLIEPCMSLRPGRAMRAAGWKVTEPIHNRCRPASPRLRNRIRARDSAFPRRGAASPSSTGSMPEVISKSMVGPTLWARRSPAVPSWPAPLRTARKWRSRSAACFANGSPPRSRSHRLHPAPARKTVSLGVLDLTMVPTH